MTMKVPIYRPSLPSANELAPYLQKIDSSRIYTNSGPLLRLFEKRIADFLGVRAESVAILANATLALSGAVTTNTDSYEKWVCPSWTFAATPQVLLSCGKNFEFADVRLDWRLDLRDLPTDDVSILDVVPFGDKIDFNAVYSSRNG